MRIPAGRNSVSHLSGPLPNSATFRGKAAFWSFTEIKFAKRIKPFLHKSVPGLDSPHEARKRPKSSSLLYCPTLTIASVDICSI
jgi:hypothetical protein